MPILLDLGIRRGSLRHIFNALLRGNMASLSLTNPSAVNLSPALLEALKPEEPVFSLAAKTSDTDAEPHSLG